MFYIQASCPLNNGGHDEDDNKLMEAIETIFPMMTESAIMVWNSIHIPLEYKYDISYMVNDIIKLLKELMIKKEGFIKINWLPDTFCSQWNVEWKEEFIEINTSWNCIVGDLEENLNRVSNINMSKWNFINEWERVIHNVIIALQECGYNENNLEDMNEIIELYSLFDGKGILYQNE